MTKRKSFIIHIDSLNILDELSDDQAGKLFKAIKCHQLGDEFEFDTLTRIAFSQFKNQFDRDSEKYIKLCEKNRLIAENRYKNNATKSTTGEPGNESLPSITKTTDNDSKSDSKSDSKDTVKTNEPFLIFSYWKEVFKKNDSAKFTPKRLKAVTNRLKQGYTLNEIKQAIKGCSVTPHNMGENDNQKAFDCLELICRNGENVERFAGNAQQIVPKEYSAITERNINNIMDLELD